MLGIELLNHKKIKMKKLLIITTLLTALTGCGYYDPILDSHEYTITDTTYVSENAFGSILSYDIILLNHYDSSYHAGNITPTGKLVDYNPRPIKALNPQLK